jgi:hypothetical protein
MTTIIRFLERHKAERNGELVALAVGTALVAPPWVWRGKALSGA